MLRALRREPSAVRLAAQLGGVLLYSFMESSDAGRALFSVFGIAFLALVVLAVKSSPGPGSCSYSGFQPASFCSSRR